MTSRLPLSRRNDTSDVLWCACDHKSQSKVTRATYRALYDTGLNAIDRRAIDCAQHRVAHIKRREDKGAAKAELNPELRRILRPLHVTIGKCRVKLSNLHSTITGRLPDLHRSLSIAGQSQADASVMLYVELRPVIAAVHAHSRRCTVFNALYVDVLTNTYRGVGVSYDLFFPDKVLRAECSCEMELSSQALTSEAADETPVIAAQRNAVNSDQLFRYILHRAYSTKEHAMKEHTT